MSAKDIIERNSVSVQEQIKQISDENERLLNELKEALEEYKKSQEQVKKLTDAIETLKIDYATIKKEKEHFQRFSYRLEETLKLPKAGDIPSNTPLAEKKVIERTDFSAIKDIISKGK